MGNSISNYSAISRFIKRQIIIKDKNMKFFKGFVDFLKGKKTNIIGILMVILGFLTEDNSLIMEGLGFITIRAAIAKK